MENNEIKQAVEAYRRCCPSGATCKNLDGTTFVMECYANDCKEHNYKCGSRICKRLRKFINILKEPKQ